MTMRYEEDFPRQKSVADNKTVSSDKDPDLIRPVAGSDTSLALDLGTTTIEILASIRGNCDKTSAPSFIDSSFNNQNIVWTDRFFNPQRLYGADVLSRMNNAVRFDLAKKMRTMALDAILASIKANHAKKAPACAVVAANTPMTHLFFGLDVAGLVDAPFKPASLSSQQCDQDGIHFLSFPGISAFVGGDIVAGIYALSLSAVSAPTLLVDLGTNGEIVLSLPGESPIVTSVAAGPAFEGGNISKGMPAKDGAIDSLSIRRGFCRIHTIGETPEPKGLCGSGLIGAVAALYSDGLIDVHGSFLSEEYRQTGFPLYARGPGQRLLLTQEDIRALQMAKAAVAAGITALLDHAGLKITEIATLFLSGNFGAHLNTDNASKIGLIPGELITKTSLAGNTSLHGALRLANHPGDLPFIEEIARTSASLSLADSAFFKEAYLKNMDLPAQ